MKKEEICTCNGCLQHALKIVFAFMVQFGQDCPATDAEKKEVEADANRDSGPKSGYRALCIVGTMLKTTTACNELNDNNHAVTH